jgi:hypothetical protein
VIVVLCLDNSNRNVGFIIEDIVSSPGFSPAHGISLDKNPALGNIHFFPDLRMIPAGPEECGSDEPGADVPFAQTSFIRAVHESSLAG